MKKLTLGLMLATAISANSYAATAPVAATAPASTTGKSTVNFEALSKPEKIKYIEEKHTEAKARADAKWKAESDDDKIAKYEHRRQAFMARRNGAAGGAQTANATAAPAAATAAPMAAQATATTPAPASTPVKK